MTSDSDCDTRTRLLETALNLIWANSYGRTSVDEICSAAECKKGSFYHFFKSKADLASLALEREWDSIRAELDQIFSPSVAPLERLKNYSQVALEQQRQMVEKLKHVPGCPFSSLGSEQCSEDDGLRQKANDVLLRFRKYFESAVREAMQDGAIPERDHMRIAEQLYLYYTGVNTQARLGNTLEPFNDMWSAWQSLLYAKQ